jgi:hypothetical protein
MGTWISHLRIAEGLLATIPDLDVPMFTVGSLAPDSGAPNADWTRFDPPKEVTHFLRPGEDEGRIKDLEFWRAYVVPTMAQDDRARYSFALGYFCHLLSDNLWSKLVAGTTKRTNAALFAERGGHAWNIVKRDWYDLDHQYVRDHSAGLYQRVFVDAPNPPAYLPFLDHCALCDQLDHIRRFYAEPGTRVLARSYPYLNAATMQRYVEDATALIVAALAVLRATPPLPAALSALELLPAQRYTAYDPPLGDES